MGIPPDFQFSQSNLQDYVDCPRRFELRHLLRLQWPALESEPYLEQERHAKSGELFHHILHQFLCGIPQETIQKFADKVELKHWWDDFLLTNPLSGLPQSRFPEHVLSSPFTGFRLIAKYDLVAIDAGNRAVIIDWKTSLHRPKSQYLRKRLQSRLYPLLLVLAGKEINQNQPVRPDQIDMIYWFAEFPDQPELISYSEENFKNDRDYFHHLIQEINNTLTGKFLLTQEEKRCQFCNYRSLCIRGEKAGNQENLEDEQLGQDEATSLVDINLDQIGEIEF